MVGDDNLLDTGYIECGAYSRRPHRTRAAQSQYLHAAIIPIIIRTIVIISIDIYRAIDWAIPNPPRLPTHTPAGEASHRARGKFGGVTETPPEAREIDYRFTLANERTFLSWIRTALGLLAGGVAVQTLVQPFHHAGVRHALAASCLALAVVVSIGAYVHWRDVKNRMDRAQPLKGTMLVPLLAISIGLVAILASVAVFYR